MSALIQTSPNCERRGCGVLLADTGRPLIVVPLSFGVVKLYCSHRCEALSRPTPPWGNRIPERRS